MEVLHTETLETLVIDITKALKQPDTEYTHYKGGEYTVRYHCTHKGEELVLYRDIYSTWYARPKEMFYGTVNVGKLTIPRFEKK